MDMGRKGVAAVLACLAIVTIAFLLNQSNSTNETVGYQFMETPNIERPYAGGEGTRCTTGSWCQQGLMCVGGFCQRPYDYVNYPTQFCERNEQCAYGYACINNLCQFV